MTFANQLKAISEETGLSIAKLAETFATDDRPISYRQFLKWSKGEATPHTATQEGVLLRLRRLGKPREPQIEPSPPARVRAWVGGGLADLDAERRVR